MSRCRCGFDWRDSPEVRASPAGLKAVRRISELCRSVTVCATEGGGEEQLYKLGLSELCETLALFAGHYLSRKNGAQVPGEIENSVCHEAVMYAFSALEEWPRGFEEFMGIYGLGTADGPPNVEPMLQLHSQCRDGTLDFLTIAIEELIENALSRHGDQIYLSPPLIKRFIPVMEYLASSAAGPRNVGWLLRNGQVRVHRVRRNGREEVLIDSNSLARYKEKLALCFTGIDVAECLRVDVDDVNELVWHGCLSPVSGPSVDELPAWRFSRNEPRRLLEAVRSQVMAETEGDQRRLIFGERTLTLLRKHKISVGRFVRDVLNGKLTPRFEGMAGGLNAFAFGKKEIVEYVFSKTGEVIIANEKSPPTFRQLARTLEKMRERNNNAYPRGLSRPDETGDLIWASGSDLARVARWVFRKVESNYV